MRLWPKRRWGQVAVLVMLLALLAAGALVLTPRADRITRANYERVQLGMSLAAVRDILGSPGDCRTGDTEPDPAPADGRPEDFAPTVLGHRFVLPWDGDRASVMVYVSPDDRVAGKRYLPARHRDHGPFGNAVWRVKCQWRRWFPG
jgi:hypothetical protein